MAGDKLENAQAVIIGAGRLGQTIGSMLRRAGVRVVAVTCRSRSRAELAVNSIGKGKPIAFQLGSEKKSVELAKCLGDLLSSSDKRNLVFITTNDDNIHSAAEELAEMATDWSEACVFHCSASLSPEVLSSLRERGAKTAVLHPMFPVFSFLKTLPQDGSICYSASGDARALNTASELVGIWKGIFIDIGEVNRSLYHAGAVMAAGHLVTLLALACKLLGEAGVPSGLAKKMVLSMAPSLLSRIESDSSERCFAQALTGPFVRGDQEVIGEHLESLQECCPEVAQLYELLGQRTMALTAKE